MFGFLNRISSLQMFETVDGGAGGAGAEPPGNNPEPKTFSQEEVNTIAAKEKNSGKRSILKTLGFSSEEEAETFVKNARTKLEKNEPKNPDLETELQTKVKEIERTKAELDKTKKTMDALKFGAMSEHVQNVVLLAQAKLAEDEEKDFTTALQEVKESYPMMFNGSNVGTGSMNKPPRKTGTEPENLGLKLGKKANKKTNNSYFRH